LAAGGYAVPVQESTFSAANVISLALCIVLLTVCGMMLVDLTRNIWSWNEAYSVNSSLIEGILNLFPN
jgi:short subunit fatty acids transporter